MLANLFLHRVTTTDDIIEKMATRPIGPETSLEDLAAEFKAG